jgi:hypothetical protein
MGAAAEGQPQYFPGEYLQHPGAFFYAHPQPGAFSNDERLYASVSHETAPVREQFPEPSNELPPPKPRRPSIAHRQSSSATAGSTATFKDIMKEGFDPFAGELLDSDDEPGAAAEGSTKPF